jgi:hypothetical protein
MKISTKDLQAAFKIVDSVQTSPVLDSSQFVRLKSDGKSISLALTGALWAEAHAAGTEGKGAWTSFLDRRPLKAFLDTATGTEIEIYCAKDKLTLKSGQRLEVAARTPVTGYESWKPAASFDLTDDQKTTLKTAVKYLPNMAGTENVEAVYFGSGYGVLVTDTLFMMACLGSLVKHDFMLPAEVAKFLVGHDGKIAADKTGVGVDLSNGYVYQSLSVKLAGYPIDKCKDALAERVKSPAVAVIKGSELLKALQVASQFLVDKNEAAEIEVKANVLTVTVDLNTSKFQRSIDLVKTGTPLPASVKWPVRRITSWFEYVTGIDDECEVTFAKTSNASVFRCTDGTRNNVILAADL